MLFSMHKNGEQAQLILILQDKMMEVTLTEGSVTSTFRSMGKTPVNRVRNCSDSADFMAVVLVHWWNI